MSNTVPGYYDNSREIIALILTKSEGFTHVKQMYMNCNVI